MYFKKLEIVGFKSFADKTTIEFEPGVTAIVGPNGCGKSNIADSIRWVLGEQSAKSLRGSSMQDVIFNGSSAKDAQNMAEVSLVLSNENKILPIDYEEVTITRRLFRSGESEYLINKNIVRLKDIHDLLLGTGIGTESYSIIEQGKMDLILNAKPEDRRVIFEEAAGITKFKSKKEEALRKLEQTDQNLLRVNDIIQEVKRQIGSIERQAKKAEVYKIEFEKLKSLEIGVARQEFTIFQNERSAKAQELESLRNEESNALSKLEESEAECATKQADADRLGDALRLAQTEELVVSSEIRRNQDRVLLNRERIGELHEKRESVLRQTEQAKKRLEEYAAEYTSLKASLEKAKLEEAESQQFLSTVEAEHAAIEKALDEEKNKITASRDRIRELDQQKIKAQEDGTSSRAKTLSLLDQEARLGHEIQSLENQIQAAQGEQAALESALASARGELDELNHRKTALEAAKETDTASIHELERMLGEAMLKESNFASKVDFLKDLTNRQEGVADAVKSILELRATSPDALPGFVGIFSEFLSVTSGYEKAAEAALETYLQAAVFHRDDELVGALEWLRHKKPGRVFLVSLENTSTATGEAKGFEGATPLCQYVQGASTVSDFLRGVLEKVYLASTPSIALNLARTNAGYVFVTMDGERFEGRAAFAGGGSSGGASESSVIGRKARLLEYEECRIAAMREIEEIRSKLDVQRIESAKLADEYKHLQESLFERESSLSRTDGQRIFMAGHLEKLRRDHEAAIQSRQTAVGEREALGSAESALQASLVNYDAEQRSLEELLRSLETALGAKAQDKDNLLMRLAATRSQQSEYAARREKIERDCQWILESKQNQEDVLQMMAKEAEEAQQKRESLLAECAELESTLAQLGEKRDELLGQVESCKNDREEVLAVLETLGKIKSEKERFLRDVRESLHGLEMRDAELGFNLDRLKERIFNAYSIDLVVQEQMAQTVAGMEEVMNQAGMVVPAEPLDLEKAHEEIRLQREKLNKMGPVNLVAIEEHQELKDRYDFLTKQSEDLAKAKNDLHEAIIKINRTTRELFIDTFSKIQKHFSDYYRLLFNGGQAELVMLDEQNPLECGIEIVVRPPGKKLQHIALLSGGEKALTAIALLFSLFKVKPSPFCILDEIDAPLDETNVDRFCRVLKDFIVGSQFILITHNKRTMNLADAMYGITMAQTGVSRVVSVRFGEKKEKAPASEEEVLVS